MSNASARPGHDYNLRILRSLALYLQDHFDAKTLSEVAAAGGLTVGQLGDASQWVSAPQFERLLIAARAVVGSDDLFKQACAYHLAEAYGALRFALRAMTPANVFRQSIERFSMVSHVGEHEVLEATRTSILIRWKASPPVHRLVCLVRHGQAAAMPTLWGLPPAVIKERSCMGLGDEACVYYFTWYDQVHWLPSVAFAALGALCAAGLWHLGVTSAGSVGFLSTIGGLLGYLREVNSIEKANRATDKLMIDALQEAVETETEARTQLLDLHRSQREWSRILEEESRDRSLAIQKITDQFKKDEEHRSRIFRGYSHDLRNPLQVMRLGADYLRRTGVADESAAKVIDELDWSVRQMNELLVELTRIASQPTGTGQLTAKQLLVADLTERVRRRLQALAHDKEIRTSAFQTREAPSSIEQDPVLFDRVMDNMLTNAVKYTARGSIVVELDGAPGFLIIKVSDTGRGIAPEDLERTFSPGASAVDQRAENSLGLGLSVVVQLLAEVGGRLEVMSKPNVGTTFWIHFPVQSPPRATQPEPAELLLKRVVSIRRLA